LAPSSSAPRDLLAEDDAAVEPDHAAGDGRRERSSTRRRVAAAAFAAVLVAAAAAAIALLDGEPSETAAVVDLAMPRVERPQVVVPPPAGAGLGVPSVTAAAYAGIPAAPPGQPLAEAPQPGLFETAGGRVLPRIADDGRVPWRAYGRGFDLRDDRPRLVIVLVGLGLSGVASGAAIDHLPADITFAVDAHAARPDHWAARARADGHEVLVSLPLQPAAGDSTDPGPRAILASLPDSENIARLETVLGLCHGCVGVVTTLGGAFADDVQALRPVLEAAQSRGLLLIDGTLLRGHPLIDVADGLGLPRLWIDQPVDDEPTAGAIDGALRRLEEIALKQGVAAGTVRPYPVTLQRLMAWWPTLAKKNLVLAPASAAAGAQVVR
jgi:hypothetical protein